MHTDALLTTGFRGRGWSARVSHVRSCRTAIVVTVWCAKAEQSSLFRNPPETHGVSESAVCAALSLAAVNNLAVLDALNSELQPKLQAVKP